jgi:hypothetical protein
MSWLDLWDMRDELNGTLADGTPYPLPPDVALDLRREALRDEVEAQVDEEYDAMRRWEATT